MVLATLNHQEVEVDRPGRMPRAPDPAELALDRLAGRQQLLGLEVGLDDHGRVQEVVLADGVVLGLGLVDARGADDLDPVPRERLDGAPQVGQPVADVRPKAQPGLQSSSPGVRSFQTSTVTSSTGNGIGGSGFVARTVTESAP